MRISNNNKKKSEISLNLTKSKIDQKHFFPHWSQNKVLPLHKLPKGTTRADSRSNETKMSHLATSYI